MIRSHHDFIFKIIKIGYTTRHRHHYVEEHKSWAVGKEEKDHGVKHVFRSKKKCK